MKNLKNIIVIFCLFATVYLQGQTTSSNKGQLRLLYLPLERVQSGGNIDVYLPTHFDFLKLFDSSTRFAPDEPSSFSSLEYTLLVQRWRESGWRADIRMETAIGFFRNHTKGDFLPEGSDAIHFGLGNSQVGPSLSQSISYVWKNWDLGLSAQVGLGPHFSQWTSGENTVDPAEWKIRGFGFTNNLMLFIGTPTWWNRWSVRGLVAYNWSTSGYRDFNVVENSGEIKEYKELKFSSKAKRPVFSISLAFDLLKS